MTTAIIWSRQLMRRIEGPIHVFKASPTVMALKESKKIIRSYNNIANALVLFESMWIDGWCKTVFKWIEGLRATLLVREPHKNSKADEAEMETEMEGEGKGGGEGEGGGGGEVATLPRLYVNLDPAILELVEEAKGLARLGVRIPEQVAPSPCARMACLNAWPTMAGMRY